MRFLLNTQKHNNNNNTQFVRNAR